MSKTNVFISSTCYDLSQIRKDLKEGIEAMGHAPILSENKDFPVNPALSSAENCVAAVRNEADVFVLIIGGRYGYKLESGKSITNTEFLTALQKGIPIYTFTLKNVCQVLPVWKNNPHADFSTVVDDNKVFEFVEDVRDNKSIWNFEFDSAQDIMGILKAQLSFLFRQCLVSHKRIQDIDEKLTSRISNKALKILVEREEYYEISIFLQMMQDEIGKYQYLKKDCDHSITLKMGRYIHDSRPFTDWMQEKIHQIERIVDSLNHLFDAFYLYFGEPGIPADIDGLYYVARKYGELYASLLEWVIDVRSTITPDEFIPAVKIMSEFPLKAIEQIESFPEESRRNVEETIIKSKSGELEDGYTLKLSLKVTIDESVQKRFDSVINKLKKDFLAR